MGDDTFPILCDTCLGDQAMVRIKRAPSDRACDVCTQAFDRFTLKPGPHARYKTTVICRVCAWLKNCCQSCVLDLTYGLPLQTRDAYIKPYADDSSAPPAVAAVIDVPASQAGARHVIARRAALLADTSLERPYTHDKGEHPVLSKLARKGIRHEQNLAKLCTFFLKGECTRPNCPYRHVTKEDAGHTTALADQRTKDRYHGVNDAVAKGHLARASDMETREREKASGWSGVATSAVPVSQSVPSSGSGSGGGPRATGALKHPREGGAVVSTHPPGPRASGPGTGVGGKFIPVSSSGHAPVATGAAPVAPAAAAAPLSAPAATAPSTGGFVRMRYASQGADFYKLGLGGN